MTEDELREAAIEYLQGLQGEPKKVYEFTAKELSEQLNKTQPNTYAYMEKLVKLNTWGTRMAFDKRVGRQIRVWWLIQKE